MATVKFTEKSPYQKEKTTEHYTDFKYKKYLNDASFTTKKRVNGTPVKVKKYGVAIFGLGRAGFIHIVNVMSNPKLTLKYIVELDQEKSKKVQEDYGLEDSVLLSPSEDDVVFSDTSVEGIIIATPTFTHESLVTKGLQSGKAVLCEKPVSQDQTGTERCYKVAKEVGKPLFCAFNRRYEPSFAEVFNQVRNGRVGRVHVIKTVSRDSPLPSMDYIKISGGIFHDCGVHDIDLICWILGEYPQEVFAAATNFIPEFEEVGDFDTVAMTLKFPSKTIGMIDLSRNSIYGYDQRVEVFGPKGMITCSNERPFSVKYSCPSGESVPPIFHSFPSRYNEGYKLELEKFVEVMAGESDDYVTGDNTLKISKIASALEQSAKTGKVVKVQY